MNIHFKEKKEPELVSWDQLDIGDVYYHIHTHKVGVKTSSNGYFYLTDKSNHNWYKRMEHGYKNFIRCSYALEVNYDVR